MLLRAIIYAQCLSIIIIHVSAEVGYAIYGPNPLWIWPLAILCPLSLFLIPVWPCLVAANIKQTRYPILVFVTVLAMCVTAIFAIIPAVT